MPSWLLWDRVRSLAKTANIYQSDRVFQDQFSIDRLLRGGEYLDWNASQAVLDQTTLAITRLDRYKDVEMMDQGGPMSLVLDLYADEASLVDPERKHTVIIKAKSKKIKAELEDLLFNRLQIDKNARPISRYACKFGDAPFEIVPTANRDGVSSLRFMSVYNFTRVETRYGDLVGFFYQDELANEPIFLHPWQVMHISLSTFEDIYRPYGRTILEGSRKPFKQLRLMEDSALVNRIVRAPERRKYKIPVGDIPPKEVPEYLTNIARMFKRRRFYNPTTGTYDERYSPLIQEEDIFLPIRSDGTGPDVESLPGAENMDKIQDIEYFLKRMIAPTKIPFSRVGIGDKAGEANNQSLSQEHSEFAKSVQWIQREIASGLTKVCIVHLMLRGYSIEDIKSFEITMTATSAIEELYRIETWQTRAGVMNDLKEFGWFPIEWIVTHFTDLTPDELEELREMQMLTTNELLTNDGGDGDGGIGGGGFGGGGEGGGGEGGDLFGDSGDLEGGGEGGLDGDGGGGEDNEKGGDLFGGEGLGESRRRELDNKRKKSKVIKILTEWHNRKRGKINSQFNYILDSCELDGLSTKEKNVTISEDCVSDIDREDLLVDISIDENEWREAFNEAYRILKYTTVEQREESDDDINESDIPGKLM